MMADGRVRPPAMTDQTPPSAPPADPAKRRAILQACFELFAERGFRSTDVEAVAERAGVGKGTVYRYFGNKEELFLATADSSMKELESHILESLVDVTDPVAVIRAAGLAYADFFEAHPGLVEILILERAEFRDSIPSTHLVYREKNRGILDELLEQGIASGAFRDIDAHQATNAFANMLYGTVVCGCLEGSNTKLRSMVETGIDIFLNGVLDHGRRRGE